MKILEPSDWKERIAFDNITYKNVRRYSLMLNSMERKIMDAEIDFYRNHFSIKQVMDVFKVLKTKGEKEIFIKAVLKRQDKILYLPNELKNVVKKIIKTEFSEYQAFFEIILNKAINQSKTNLMPKLFKMVLGDFYTPVLRKINKYRKAQEIPTLQKTLKPEAIENMARNLIESLQKDYQLSVMYGRSSIRKTVPISIVDDYGYGEWISKNVSYNNNRFFIYSNNNRLTDVGLTHMVYFNVYPGMAHFYNTIVDDKTKNTCFDNGASLIINGWAMYSMCHNKNTAFSQNFLIEGTTIARHLLTGNLEKGMTRAYVYLLGKYPKVKAMDYLMDYAMYPGHYLSYVLGELTIEASIEKGFADTPIEFLNNLRQVNVGDYICLYSPKKQKQMFKNIITANVVDKFTR